MEKNSLFVLVLCLLLSSCAATVPSIPTSHIPEKAHEVNVSGAVGVPFTSASIAYNPHKNFGLVLAGDGNTTPKFLPVSAQNPGRTYIEGGIAVYYPINNKFALSLTPTIGRGHFFVVNTEGFFVTRSIVKAGGTENRQALFLNSRYKVVVDEILNIQLRFGVKVASSTLNIQIATSSAQPSTFVEQTLKITTVEPMLYLNFQVHNLALFGVLGADLSRNRYDNKIIEQNRLLGYISFGVGYTFNGLKPWAEKAKKKKLK